MRWNLHQLFHFYLHLHTVHYCHFHLILTVSITCCMVEGYIKLTVYTTSIVPDDGPYRTETCSTELNKEHIVPCWRYLLGITDSATQSFTLFIYFRLHRRYYTTVELELSNPRTVDSRTLVFVDSLFSSTLAYHLLIAHQSLASLILLSFSLCRA
jgi:hypothetical protein